MIQGLWSSLLGYVLRISYLPVASRKFVRLYTNVLRQIVVTAILYKKLCKGYSHPFTSSFYAIKVVNCCVLPFEQLEVIIDCLSNDS